MEVSCVDLVASPWLSGLFSLTLLRCSLGNTSTLDIPVIGALNWSHSLRIGTSYAFGYAGEHAGDIS